MSAAFTEACLKNPKTRRDDRFYIYGMRPGPVKKGQFCKGAARGTTFLLTESGTLYCTRFDHDKVVILTGPELVIYFTTGDLTAMRRLGVVTRREINTWQNQNSDERRKRSVSEAKDEMLKLAQKLGITDVIRSILFHSIKSKGATSMKRKGHV